jgi:hypothetical protein
MHKDGSCNIDESQLYEAATAHACHARYINGNKLTLATATTVFGSAL